ncbi:MAG: putative endonuclease [Acidimicrobiia bacterium]|nr:putative endonuclease [Acidimicrobiia bacterium]
MLVELLRERDLAEVKYALEVGEFDAGQRWALDGCINMTQWLVHHGRLGRDDAKRLLALARVLRHFPVTAAAWESGAISSTQAKIVADAVPADPVYEAHFADSEAELIPHLSELTSHHTRIVMRHWKHTADNLLDNTPRPEPKPSEAHLSKTWDDTWRLDANLSPADGEIVNTAIEAVITDNDPDHPRTRAQRVADALTDLCRSYLDHRDRPLPARRRPHVSVDINLDDLRERSGGRFATDGGPVDDVTMAQWLCDCELSSVLWSGSTILNYGRSTHTVPNKLRRAVIRRDRHCRFPGCDRPAQWCQVHHNIWWDHGGPTDLNNLVLLCSRHHHILHRPGWHSALSPDGTFTVTTPNGQIHHSRPPP